MPLFSVILSLYNKELYVYKTLESVILQTYDDFELIIVNDGSTDDSEKIVFGFQDARIRYFYQKNAGASAARNLGLQKAKGQYMAFVDADDYWYPDYLKSVSENIKLFANNKVFSTAIELETSKIVVPAVYSIKKTTESEVINYFDASMKESILFTSATVIHKSVFDKIGLFDKEIKSGQDTDLWIRIGLQYDVVFCWKVLVRYVYDPKSLRRDDSLILKKLNFEKFEDLEKTIPKLKKFLDINRYSLALRLKMNGKKTHFAELYKQINLRSLPYIKRILLLLPPFIIRVLVKLKKQLENMKICKTVFK